MTAPTARVARGTLSRLVPPVRSFVARRKRLAATTQQLLDRFPVLQDAVVALAVADSDERYQRWIAAYDTLDDSDLAAMREEQEAFANPPHFTVLATEGLTQSLSAQVYERWEPRVVGQAASDWNIALSEAASEHVVVVEPGTRLRPHALFMFARTIDRHRDAVLIYADDDVLESDGRRTGHYFKPDWNEALLRSQNYLGSLVCFRRSLAPEVGGCRDELDGNYAWGLCLRIGAVAPPGTIHHLPFVLAHRRAGDAGPGGDQRQRVARAQEQRLAELGQRVRVEPVGETSYRTHYALSKQPRLVSVIVPTTAKLELLRPCLDGVLGRTTYPRLEVLVVVNGMGVPSPAQRSYLDAIAAHPNVRVLFQDDSGFNFSRTNNWASEQARGELLCFLNDDTEVIWSDWLSELVAHVLQERVAGVGAMLLFPNGRIQHAGIVLGVGHVAGHTYERHPGGITGYHERALVDQDVSAVSAACMVVRRDAFSDVGGFDKALAVAFNDIDLCLRLRKAGWRIVWTPSAELYHRESASFVRHDDAREAEWRRELDLMHSRWGSDLFADPHYNPNLSLDRFRLWEPAFPPRVSYPWRTAVASATRLAARRHV